MLGSKITEDKAEDLISFLDGLDAPAAMVIGKQIPDEYLDDFEEHFGRYSCYSILVGCLAVIGTRWKPLEKGGAERIEPYLRNKEAFEIGARLCEFFTYIANRTFEDRKISTGICVFEDASNIPQYLNMEDTDPWILKFRKPLNFLEISRSSAFDLALMCDGKNTMLCCDIEANLLGIIDISNGPGVSAGDYDIVTTRHGTVELKNKFMKPFIFDGFEWRWDWQTEFSIPVKDWFQLEEMTSLGDEEDREELEFRWQEFDRLLVKL